ncbi:aminoglycoside phosphotransferase family protein [Pseudalkalibacillus caeni]|uniref:Aminoglycoside phosphotransferase domain-containing protein n=1 Tax=Exobacillus caeni TaxID=2574798 RepID=A0A5R9EZ20_9BACL|nr:aminoglycoside 3'-phosphotransferase/choline kinase family protein [Pseudalkalibacillus caeni]TLS36081.1 hypothetical protein FCL54_16975 [Pseudalkalibacillus caeni]
MLLNEISSYEQYESMKHQQEYWDRKIEEIIMQENMKLLPVRRFSYGAAIVYSYDERYVFKLYPSFEKDQFEREKEALEAIKGQITSVETPELIAAGNFEGWDYIIMTQLKGDLLIDIWDGMTFKEKQSLSERLGKTIKEFHQISAVNLKGLKVEWDRFIQEQLLNMKEHHQNQQLKDYLYEELDSYVKEETIDYHPDLKLLTGEYTPFNLMMNKVDGTWKLTGVIDFADCFVGDGDYDLLGPILFMYKGDEELIRRFLHAYGYGENDLNENFRKKLMTYTLLHRYSDINYFISLNKRAGAVRSLEELGKVFFGFG